MTPSKTCHAIRAILRSVGSPIRITHDGLYDVEPVFPDVGLDSVTFRNEYLGYNVARKREMDSPDTETAAIAAFARSENECASVTLDSIFAGLDWLSKNALLRARQLAHDVLGDVPRNWTQYCSFTGGASTSRNRLKSHPALKWWARPPLDVTPLALKHLLEFKQSCEVLDTIWDLPGVLSCSTYGDRSQAFYKLVPGSHFKMVEKNYKTKRVILLEPDGNMLLQKGVGNIIRRSLRKVGINLNSQKRNQQLAFAGSLSGSLGTVDIAQASDSVTLALLQWLIPDSWYELIYDLRSPCYLHDGKWHTMRKVSSMGNGFTFELESLVFYCLSQALIDVLKPTDTRISIFGDDIIVASSICGSLEIFLARCGFKLNSEKSFWRGPFRESCGKHYHAGADVTPFYVKKDLDLSQTYRLYNQLFSWTGECPTNNHALQLILDMIPLKDRCQIPLEYDPTVGLYDGSVCTKPIRSFINRDGWHVLQFSVLEPEIIDTTERCDDELSWLFSHVETWVPSCPIGTVEYTPFTLVRDGELRRRQVTIPAARVTWPIP